VRLIIDIAAQQQAYLYTYHQMLPQPAHFSLAFSSTTLLAIRINEQLYLIIRIII
jgi:hypothetical protein